MDKELYEQVLAHLMETNTLADTNSKAGVPPYIWRTLQYLPNWSGERILDRQFKAMDNVDRTLDRIRKAGVFDIYPFKFGYYGTSVMYLGEAAFLRYDVSEMCFIVSRYPNGYEEVTRNCSKWGKLFAGCMYHTELDKRVLSAIIWYSYCEVCYKIDKAMHGIRNNALDAYSVLKKFMKETMDYDMVSYEIFQGSNMKDMIQYEVHSHLKTYGDRVYELVNKCNNTVARFCYDYKTFELEWLETDTDGSTLVSISLPKLSGRDYFHSKCINKEVNFMKLCVPGLLAIHHMELSWRCALSYKPAPPIESLNANTIVVATFKDLV